MIIYVLEDNQDRLNFFKEKLDNIPGTVICDNPNQLVPYINNISESIIVDYIFLDHDLGEQFCTGYDIAVVICDQFKPNQIGKIIIHSINTIGANYMNTLLQEHGFNSQVIPFTTLMTLDNILV